MSTAAVAPAVAPNAPILAVGQHLDAHTSDSRIHIRLQRVAAAAWDVTTYQGGTLRIEDTCAAFDTEPAAGIYAAAMFALYEAETS